MGINEHPMGTRNLRWLKRVGFLLILVVLSSCQTERESGRNETLQFMTYWLVVLAPVIATVLKVRSTLQISFILAVQVIGYLNYEPYVPKDWNIRVDIFLPAASVLWTLYLLVVATRTSR
jgi:hypothetical protein